ncbi:MAG TPA: hypothetical protein VJK05_03105 [archaeon]|nr:hypothetical protein [archaeon]
MNFIEVFVNPKKIVKEELKSKSFTNTLIFLLTPTILIAVLLLVFGISLNLFILFSDLLGRVLMVLLFSLSLFAVTKFVKVKKEFNYLNIFRAVSLGGFYQVLIVLFFIFLFLTNPAYIGSLRDYSNQSINNVQLMSNLSNAISPLGEGFNIVLLVLAAVIALLSFAYLFISWFFAADELFKRRFWPNLGLFIASFALYLVIMLIRTLILPF